jgi:hypothetical protein
VSILVTHAEILICTCGADRLVPVRTGCRCYFVQNDRTCGLEDAFHILGSGVPGRFSLAETLEVR